MSYYVQLFCNSKYIYYYLALLVVLSCIYPSDADSQQAYDVNIINNSVTVKPWGYDTAYRVFDEAYNPGQLDYNGMDFANDSPVDNSGHRAQADYDELWGSAMPSTSHNALQPTLGARNPLGLSGYRYFQFGLGYWKFRSLFSYLATTTPLQEHYGTLTTSYNVQLTDKLITPNTSTKNTIFNFTNFKNDILYALVGSQNFDFILRLVQIMNSTPTGTNFTYTVPPIFGFNAGITISLPFYDILHGTGDWSQFANIITFFRSLLSVLYYLAVVWVIIRCIAFYQ